MPLLVKIALAVVYVPMAVMCIISGIHYIAEDFREEWAHEPKRRQSVQPSETTKIVHCCKCRKRYTPECMMNYDCECGGQWEWTVDNGYCQEGAEWI